MKQSSLFAEAIAYAIPLAIAGIAYALVSMLQEAPSKEARLIFSVVVFAVALGVEVAVRRYQGEARHYRSALAPTIRRLEEYEAGGAPVAPTVPTTTAEGRRGIVARDKARVAGSGSIEDQDTAIELSGESSLEGDYDIK